MVGRDVDDALDVGLAFEHLAEVFVRPDARGGTPFLAVPGLHDALRHVAAAARRAITVPPRRVAQELPHVVARAERTPVDVVVAAPVGVDDSHELQVGPPNHVGVDLSLGLRAAAHLREHHHVARGDVARPAQHTPGNDREGRRRSHTAERIASRDPGHAAASPKKHLY